MAPLRTSVFRLGFETLAATRLHRLMRPLAAGAGLIFTLHRVCPHPQAAFSPNAILSVTPRFLATAIERVLKAGYEPVDMDGVADRLATGDRGRPFVAFTLDDGYRDVAEHALPIFERFSVPACFYIAPGFAERRAGLWWETMAAVIAGSARVRAVLDGRTRVFDTLDTAGKWSAWQTLYTWVRARDEASALAFVEVLGAAHGIDGLALTDALTLDWAGVQTLASSPVVTIGAHSISHPRLATLPEPEAGHEIAESRRILEARLGRPVQHFAYPVGDPGSAGVREFGLCREAGFRTGVTTRPGVLFSDHARHLFALPRVSLNGAFQEARFVDVLLSGAPFLITNGGRRVNAA